MLPFGGTLSSIFDVRNHRKVTQAVHAEGGKILMQILHSGRYGYQPFVVSASAVKSPISMFKPRALTERGIQSTIKAYVRCARLAQKAGYDGVEIMGSEGYLLNQFLCVAPTSAPTAGEAASRTACACRWKLCDRCGRPWVRISS